MHRTGFLCFPVNSFSFVHHLSQLSLFPCPTRFSLSLVSSFFSSSSPHLVPPHYRRHHHDGTPRFRIPIFSTLHLSFAPTLSLFTFLLHFIPTICCQPKESAYKKLCGSKSKNGSGRISPLLLLLFFFPSEKSSNGLHTIPFLFLLFWLSSISPFSPVLASLSSHLG
jgi:hypothetical protein